jgi:cell division protein FtsN
MVMDYSGRRQVAKNRPRKQPVGIFAVILISAVSMSFALGVLTGWFVFRSARKADQGQPPLAAGAKGAPQAPAPQAQYPNPETHTSRGAEPPLTFYETLPKGGKAVIGSGLNPAKKESLQSPKPVPPPPPRPVAQPPSKPAAAVKAEQADGPAEVAKKGATESAAAPKPEGAAGKFCVQVASTRDRKEAEALKTRLAGRGFPAFVVESTIKDRGTWFRVRVGKHLSQRAAGDLAAKAGKGSIVIPE